MVRGWLTDGHSMFGPDDGGLGEESIADAGLDVLDLLNGLLLGEPVQEQINIGSRAELLVVELAETTLGPVELFRDREQGVDDGRPCCNHVVPGE